VTTPPRSDDTPLQRAGAAFRRGDLLEALHVYDQMLRGPGVAALPPERGAAWLGRALANQLLGNHAAALTDAVNALQSWRAAPGAWVAQALVDVAGALEPSNPPVAEEFWRVAFLLALRAGDRRLAGRIAAQRAARAGSDSELARMYWQDAETMARSAGDDGTATAALVNIARIELEAGGMRAASLRIGEAMALGPGGPALAAAAGVLADLAARADRGGDHEQATIYLEQVIAVDGGGDARLRARALAALAGIARESGNPALALRRGSEAMDVLRTAGDASAAAQAGHDLGVIGLESADPAAGERLIDALVVARRHNLPALAASLSRALATSASRRGDHLRALGYAEQAADFGAGAADVEACAVTLGDVALEAERWRRFDIAIAAHEGAARLHAGAGREHLAEVHRTAAASAGAAVVADAERQRSVQAGLDVASRVTGKQR